MSAASAANEYASPPEFKLVLLGDVCVGKSCIVQRFVKNTFDAQWQTTIGASFQAKSVVCDAQPLKLNVWDTAGSERYRSLGSMYYRKASAALLVFDITRLDTFRALSSWIAELQSNCGASLLLALVGNKSDLGARRQVLAADARALAEQHNALYHEVSACTGAQVEALFDDVCRRLLASDHTPLRVTRPHSMVAFSSERVEPGAALPCTATGAATTSSCCS